MAKLHRSRQLDELHIYTPAFIALTHMGSSLMKQIYPTADDLSHMQKTGKSLLIRRGTTGAMLVQAANLAYKIRYTVHVRSHETPFKGGL
jgi:hypothetical protein